MGALNHVKRRLLSGTVAWLYPLIASAASTPPPDAREILREVRASQATQNETLTGRIRTGPTSIPFRLIFSEGAVKYEFSNPAATVQLRLGEKEARLSETTKGGTERITGARFREAVRGSDISYEDLSLRFLYWSKAAVEGEESKLLRKCWIVRVEAPSGSDSAYSQVRLWVDQESGALMQAEAFDLQGKFARRFKVISGQKIAGAWYLKQMRIEAPGIEGKDRSPTYLEVQGVEK